MNHSLSPQNEGFAALQIIYRMVKEPLGRAERSEEKYKWHSLAHRRCQSVNLSSQ